MQRGWGAPTIIALLIVVGGLAGLLFVPMAISRDQASAEWLAGQVGGSSIYALNLSFARALPFIIAAGVALALFQRFLKKTGDQIVGQFVTRHDKSSMAAHWVNAIAMGICIITAAWLVRWFPRPFSTETVYLLHFIGAGLVMASIAHHLTYHGVSGGRGLVPSSKDDIKQTIAETVGYAGVFSKKRAALGIQLPQGLRRSAQRLFVRKWGITPHEEEKYLASEKVLSYSVWFILMGVLAITGTLKALRYVLPVPDAILQISTFLHDGALVWVLIQLTLHVAAVVLPPVNRPLLVSMFTSKLPVSYVQENLTRWYNRLTGNSASESDPAAQPKTPAAAGR